MFKDFQGPIGLDSEGLFLHIGLIKEVYCSTNKDFFFFLYPISYAFSLYNYDEPKSGTGKERKIKNFKKMQPHLSC